MPSCHELILRVAVESVQGNPVFLEWIGTSGSFGIVARPLEFLSRFKLRPPPLEVRRESRDSFPEEAKKGPSSRDEKEKRGSSKVVAGPSVFLSSGDGYVGELLELHQGCQGPF